MTDHRALATWFTPGVRAAVITGAGISTASGIAASRGSDGSWKHAAPVQMQDFLRDPAMRRRYWARRQLWRERARSSQSKARTIRSVTESRKSA
jgi:NAD-dependent SIR2 family protein deacetylase